MGTEKVGEVTNNANIFVVFGCVYAYCTALTQVLPSTSPNETAVVIDAEALRCTALQ